MYVCLFVPLPLPDANTNNLLEDKTNNKTIHLSLEFYKYPAGLSVCPSTNLNTKNKNKHVKKIWTFNIYIICGEAGDPREDGQGGGFY